MFKVVVVLVAFVLCTLEAAKFKIKYPDGTVLYDDLEKLDDAIKDDERLNKIMKTEAVQIKMAENYHLVEANEPEFHRLMNQTNLNPSDQKRANELAVKVFQKYYKPLFMVAMGMEGLMFSVEE